MTNILVECPQLIASVRVGVLEPLRPLKAAGLCQVRYLDTRLITRADINWCDVFISVRGCEYPSLRAVRAAKAAGRFLIYFLDDDLLNIPDGIASTRYYKDYKIKVYLTEILGMCDILWAVSEKIVQQYRNWCQRTVLLRVPKEVLRLPPALKEPIHILYAGSVDHSTLVHEILAPVVKRVLAEYLGRVDFTFIGANPGLNHVDGVYYYPFFESYEKYHHMVLSGDFSIGLAPVYDLPFYSCKYYNKFIEYSSYGMAGVYSDCDPYRQIIRPKDNGILCQNTSESWYQALKQLLDTPQLVTELAERASNILREDFNYSAVSQTLRQEIPEITSFCASNTILEEIRLPSMQVVFYQERFLLLFRIYGPLAVFVIPAKAIQKLYKMIKKKLRRK